MPDDFETRLAARETYLLAEPRGPVTLATMQRLAEELARETGARGGRGVLIDCAGLRGALPLGQLMSAGQTFARLLPGVRLAAVNAPAEWHDNDFSENVMANRGGILRHFRHRRGGRGLAARLSPPHSTASDRSTETRRRWASTEIPGTARLTSRGRSGLPAATAAAPRACSSSALSG